MLRRRSRAVVAVAALLLGASMASAQKAPLTSHEFPMPIDSGLVLNKARGGGDGQVAELVYSNQVRVFGAPWLRLAFDEAVLSGMPEAGDGSYLVITSLRDNGVQRLNMKSIQDWSNTSAYFNGDTVKIELFAYPGTGFNRIRMSKVTAGAFEQGGGPDSICGAIDDRTLSTYPANARILPMGCTGWLITNGNCANRFLTAGHCFIPAPATAVVQFNVPLSTAGGGLVNPPPEHQYPVVMSSVQAVETAIGNDWSQFFTSANSNTGLHAREAQGGAAYSIANAPAVAGQTLRITGYGTTNPADPTVGGVQGGLPLNQNQVQKTHTGAYTNLVGTRIEYAVDTTGGNSGSPVVNGTSPSGIAFGIHTNAGCNPVAPINDNSGTAIQNAGLQAALANPLGTCAPYTAPTCFESLFASNNGGSAGGAVYFDLEVAGAADLEVTHLFQNTGIVGSSFNVVIYLTPNTHVGKELLIGQWTQVATGSGASEAENTPSLIALSNRFTLKAGKRYGVAIRSNGLGHEYTDGTGANEEYSNANLRMTFGRAGNVAFTAPLIAAERVWNGRFCYNTLAASGTNCLDTIYAQNNFGSLGGTVFFNANVSASANLIVNGLRLNVGVSTPIGTAFTASVYTRPGTFAGFETNAAAWTLRTTASGISALVNTPTPATFATPITLTAGSNTAFAIVMDANANHTYTNGTGANQNYNNANLSIVTGSATNAAFGPSTFTQRVFNGALCYYVDTSGCTNTVTEQAPPNPDLAGFNSNAAGGGVSAQQVAESFSTPVARTINGMRLWGVYTGNNFVPPTQSFTVNIYADAAGNPGAVPIYTANVLNVPVEDAGVVQTGFSTPRPLYQFDLSVPNFNATAGTTYWLSPLGTTDGFTWCWQFSDSAGTVRARNTAVAVWNSFASSTAFELCGTPAACYANCDGVGGLTANDFACFLTAYTNGLPYANCDGIGGLTANDFICFLTAYNAGCP